MILVISGSSRRGSFNSRLACLVADSRPDDTVTVLTDLRHLPFYDGDTEADGTPGAVADLRAAVSDADLVVVVTPEYNGTVPGLLGNAIDWLSRPARNSALQSKPVLVLSASPTPYGGARAADHLRTVLTRIGAHVHPGGLSVGAAHQRLNEQSDPQLVGDLAELLNHVLDQHPLLLTA
jgi:chromate reductase